MAEPHHGLATIVALTHRAVPENATVVSDPAAQYEQLPHDDKGARVLMVMWSVLSFALVFLLLRLYCKRRTHGGLWWDDTFLIVSWILLLICNTINTVGVVDGVGKHIWDVDPTTLPRQVFWGTTTGSIAIVATAWSKTSFALSLLRFNIGSKRAIWFIIWSINVLLGMTAVLIWFPCQPIRKLWDRDTPGTCWNSAIEVNIAMTTGIYSGMMDIVLAVLPWPIIAKLKIKKSEKLGVFVAMSMGVVAGATGFVKSAMISAMIAGDYTYNMPNLAIWNAIEVSTTIMAASIPMLRMLLRRVKRSTVLAKPTNRKDVPFNSMLRLDENVIYGSHIGIETTVSVGGPRRHSWHENWQQVLGSLPDVCDEKRCDPERSYLGKILRKDEVMITYTQASD